MTNPAGLWFLLLLLPVGLILVLGYRTHRADLVALAGRWRERTVHNVHLVKWFFAALALVLFVLFTALAASGISWGQYAVSTSYTGTDVALLVDVSRSMLAEDVYPSRIKRVSGVIRDVIGTNPGTTFSLVVFKGKAVEIVPPTEDDESLYSVDAALDPTMFSSTGTDIEQGIRVAAGSFPAQDGAKRVILLFSDGGALTGDALRAAHDAALRNISVSVVAAGTAAGGEIPLGNGNYVLNPAGRRVVTQVDAAELAKIAQAGGGTLFTLTDPLITQKLDALIAGGSVKAGAGEYRYQTREQYRLFVVAGLICLLIVISTRVVRWKGLI